MTSRVYGVDGHLAHDPATGLTHHAPHPLPAGRWSGDPAEVNRWPVVAPDQHTRSQPASICWSPIVRCNLHCPHCLDDTSVRGLGPADRNRIAQILASSDILGVDISGGEPLLLKDLPDLARTVTAGGRAAVSITTNGTHLQRRVPHLAGVVDAIRVSLDGATEATHDRLRGTGSFTHAIAGIRAAVQTGVCVQIQTVLMATNQTETQSMIDLAHDLGVNGLTLLQMLPIGAGLHQQNQMLTDVAALDHVHRLHIPDTLRVRLRTRELAGGFTVVRADGRIWRNDQRGLTIAGLKPLTTPADLTLTAKDGSA
ncbi:MULTISPECIES: radical SAM protein [unclassified Micromonospora]|uniref:radical SAM protein n=1 Tax=unclassified Micromonospora TaxID=2617518 RepID=UPI003A8A28B6